MTSRTSVLLPDELMRRLRDRARRRDSTLTAEIRAAVEQYLIGDDPNAGLLEMAGRYSSREGGPALDSDALAEEMADDIERDAFNREPGE